MESYSYNQTKQDDSPAYSPSPYSPPQQSYAAPSQVQPTVVYSMQTADPEMGTSVSNLVNIIHVLKACEYGKH